MSTPEEKSEEIATITAINFGKVLATLIGAGYVPDKARPMARLILALVGISMLAAAIGNK